MAASSDQPVSVGNLAAALEGGALGGETVLYSDRGNTAATVALSEPMEDFELLRITLRCTDSIGVAYHATTDVFVQDIKATRGASIMSFGSNSTVSNYPVSGSGTTLHGQSGKYVGIITRVTGIRTGGGQLLAKLLRDLCKEVA